MRELYPACFVECDENDSNGFGPLKAELLDKPIKFLWPRKEESYVGPFPVKSLYVLRSSLWQLHESYGYLIVPSNDERDRKTFYLLWASFGLSMYKISTFKRIKLGLGIVVHIFHARIHVRPHRNGSISIKSNGHIYFFKSDALDCLVETYSTVLHSRYPKHGYSLSQCENFT